MFPAAGGRRAAPTIRALELAAAAGGGRLGDCFGPGRNSSCLIAVAQLLGWGIGPRSTWRPFSSSSSSAAPGPQPSPPRPPLPLRSLQTMVCEIVASGVGSLDEMEASLHLLSPGLPITPALVAHVVDSCKAHHVLCSGGGGGRRLLRFLSWCRRKEKESGNGDGLLGDAVFNQAIRALAEMKDLNAMGIAISDLHKDRGRMGLETFVRAVNALVGSGRAEDAVRLFRSLEERMQLPPPPPGVGGGYVVASLVDALCAKGHARKARGVAWHHRDNLAQHSGTVQRSILHGWCVHGNAREARRALDEMKMSGLRPGPAAYNDLLRCICQRNLRFNPSALVPEATGLMTEMRSSGVAPSAVSYNILLSCLGRARRVKEACRILGSMLAGGNAGCSPDWISYYLVIRVLYLTGRFGRGGLLVDRMLERGMMPPPRFYNRLIGILCGVEEVEHALQIVERMKRWCNQQDEMGPTYDLLIAKLCRSGRFGVGRFLYDDAIDRGIAPLQSSSDLLDPSKIRAFKPMKTAEKLSRRCEASVQKQKEGSLGPRPKVRRIKGQVKH